MALTPEQETVLAAQADRAIAATALRAATIQVLKDRKALLDQLRNGDITRQQYKTAMDAASLQMDRIDLTVDEHNEIYGA